MPAARSYLFIPGDSEKKLAKADGAGADAVIIDLEDSVGLANKQKARDLAARFIADRPRDARRCQLWIRINPFDAPEENEADLKAISEAGLALDGVVLPKANGPEEVARLSQWLDEDGEGHKAVKVLSIATETAVAPFHLGRYADAELPRLSGLTWGAEDLSAALGASTNKDANGALAFTYQMVRSLCLMAAKAAGVDAIESVYTDFRDLDGHRAASMAARAEGFNGQMAIHPAQVPVINAAFTPSSAEIDHAKRVVEAFDAAPGAGVVGLDGQMLDVPHLKQAKAVLALADAYTDPA
ncbi:MAG: CoA ester lyase [Pseudomonadota bacterium]